MQDVIFAPITRDAAVHPLNETCESDSNRLINPNPNPNPRKRILIAKNSNYSRMIHRIDSYYICIQRYFNIWNN